VRDARVKFRTTIRQTPMEVSSYQIMAAAKAAAAVAPPHTQ
jgi:hypothetical protein